MAIRTGRAKNPASMGAPDEATRTTAPRSKGARWHAAIALVLAAGLAGCSAAPDAARPLVGTDTRPAGQAVPSQPSSPSATTSPTGAPVATLLASGALSGMRPAAGAKAVPSRGGAELPPTAAGSLSGRVIVVDPGHNGVYRAAVNLRQVPAGNGGSKACNSSGTASLTGVAEHTLTWRIALRLVALLRAEGASVLLTRPDDAGIGPCVDERAKIANRARADLLLSIHGDGNTKATARGFHVIVSSTMAGGKTLTVKSKTVAGTLVGELGRRTGLPRSNYIGGGTGLSVRRDIAGLNLLSRTPGVMAEVGNLRNRADWKLLAQADTQQRIATALAATARRYLSR